MNNIIQQNKTIKIHNDFYKLNIGSWNALEQNIFFGILANCHNQSEFVFTLADLNSFIVGHRLTANEMLKQVLSLEKRIFKLDCTVLKSVNATLHQRQKLNLFSSFEICYNGKKNDFENGKLKELKIKINPDFAYLINDVRKNYTEYDLQEFLSIKGKYTRTLYQNLKKFRSTGILRVKWENFLDLMGISETYKSGDIDKRILKPSVKALTGTFQNIMYTKIKQKGRGRGGKVVAIEFVFKPQTNINSQKTSANTYNHKAPSSALTHKAPSSALTHKAPSSALTHKAPSSALTHKAPSSALTHKAPNSALTHKTPSSALTHKTPSSALTHKTPSNDEYELTNIVQVFQQNDKELPDIFKSVVRMYIREHQGLSTN